MRFYTNVQMVGDHFLVRGYEDGKKFIMRDKGFFPTLFLPSKVSTEFTTLEGNYVKPINPGTVMECRKFYNSYSQIDNFTIYGNTKYIYQYISEKYPENEIKFDTNQIKIYTIDIEVASENGFPDVYNSSEEILLISIQDYSTKKIITWGVNDFDNTDNDVTYKSFASEYDLLRNFIDWWMLDENIPEILTGWNIELYDVPYIIRRIYKVLGENLTKRFSPWGLVSEEKKIINGRECILYDVGGISQLDYLNLYKKFTYKAQESYRLDYIAEVELGQKKLDHSEFETFKEFYTNGWNKFVEYNIKDVQLVDRLEDKMKLIELAVTMAYDAKVNYSDVFYQVRMWDTIIYNYLKKKNIAIPPLLKSDKSDKYAGAYVKEPKPGMYDYVVSFDLNSLYPHLIMQYAISPETLVEVDELNNEIVELERSGSDNHKLNTLKQVRELSSKVSVDKLLNKELDLQPLKELNLTMTANGALYRRVKGMMPELMGKMYDERTIFKKRMLQAKQQYEKNPTKALEKEIARCNNIQMAKKISLNSAYGAIGNQYFRYYKLKNAEAITLSGQVSIRWIENKMNEYLNRILKTGEDDYVIASDTDSIYLNMGHLVDKIFSGKEKTPEKVVNFLDTVCKNKIEDYIGECYSELATYVNAYEQKMEMKRENIADRGIWTAKKRYILNVWNSEGVQYTEPKLKIMGIEAIKSSTPAPCRKMIKDALKIMMNDTEDDVISFIQECKREFKSLPPEDIAFPRSVSNISKYHSNHSIYKKASPIHVRGALLYNYYIKKNGLTNKYSIINDGEKVKFIYLKVPNTIFEDVISFIQQFPKELELENYIDYELQFDKSFIKPLKILLDAIGWEVEKTPDLTSLWC